MKDQPLTPEATVPGTFSQVRSTIPLPGLPTFLIRLLIVLAIGLILAYRLAAAAGAPTTGPYTGGPDQRVLHALDSDDRGRVGPPTFPGAPITGPSTMPSNTPLSATASIGDAPKPQSNDAPAPSTVGSRSTTSGGMHTMEGKQIQNGSSSSTSNADSNTEANRAGAAAHDTQSVKPKIPEPQVPGTDPASAKEKASAESASKAIVGAPGTEAESVKPKAPEPPVPGTDAASIAAKPHDEFSWLEGSTDPRALAWVNAQNLSTEQVIAEGPRFARNLEIIAAGSGVRSSPIGTGAILNSGMLYDVVTDSQHSRGIWRRTSLQSFRTAHPQWETLLDIDELSTRENKQYWFSAGGTWFGDRCLVALADGGGIASISWREFDVERKRFVDDGFIVPAGKGTSITWVDQDTVLIATDFGEHDSLNQHGWPIVVKRWSRGTPLSSSVELFRAPPETTKQVLVQQLIDVEPDKESLAYIRERRLSDGDRLWLVGAQGKLAQMTMPPHVNIFFRGLYRGNLIFSPRVDWAIGERLWRAGSILSMPMTDVTQAVPRVQLIVAPGERETIDDVQITKAGVLAFGSKSVRGTLTKYELVKGAWKSSSIALPDYGAVRRSIVEMSAAGPALVRYENYLQGPTIYEVDIWSQKAKQITRWRDDFDGKPYLTEQFEAASADGTKIPYFVVRPKAFKFDGQAPTLLHAYGAFSSAIYPFYSRDVARLWFEKGGVFVSANVRGGGEFGPRWHVTGVERQRTYEDFIAIANDLVAKKITSPRRLGIEGHSAGGLLMGVAMTQHPELFNAVILEAPYLDQMRADLTHIDQAAEFGDVGDPKVLEFLQDTSPYHNLKKNAQYPVPLIISSTTDDKVLPAIPRRFAARMHELGFQSLYYETAEGGHSIGGPQDQAKLSALRFTYLEMRLMDTPQELAVK